MCQVLFSNTSLRSLYHFVKVMAGKKCISYCTVVQFIKTFFLTCTHHMYLLFIIVPSFIGLRWVAQLFTTTPSRLLHQGLDWPRYLYLFVNHRKSLESDRSTVMLTTAVMYHVLYSLTSFACLQFPVESVQLVTAVKHHMGGLVFKTLHGTMTLCTENTTQTCAKLWEHFQNATSLVARLDLTFWPWITCL